MAAKQLNVPLFNNLQLLWNELRAKKASDPTPPLDALPITLLPCVPPSIPSQVTLKTLSPPIVPPIPHLTTAILLQTQIDPKFVKCIHTGAARMGILEAENKKMRAELTENQKKKALLSKKDRTKAMIDEAATKASETATSTSNKR